ncbi:hypothetical protein ASE51_13080 [Bacillus sp. Root147]|nr:hypothetical protein ASE51_13080 [Bacillus sp. Root147]
MSSYGLLATPLLIPVQDFAFRGRPVILLVASAFSAGVFAFPSNQQLEVPTHIKPTFTITAKNSNGQ